MNFHQALSQLTEPGFPGPIQLKSKFYQNLTNLFLGNVY
jgi:hypothetical protein